MSIYQKNKPRKQYRKIYEQQFGPIPKDIDGRSYDIHHIDGNHTNNDPTNLQCVSIQEHYDIHYAQADWAACRAISMRMSMSPEEKSKLSRLSNLKRIENGTHIFLSSGFQKEVQRKLVENGTHHFLGDTNPGITACRERVMNGSHHFLKTGNEHPQHDKTIHTLYHSDGRIFTGTQYEFRQTYPDINQGNLSSLLSKTKTKQGRYVRSVKGWSLTQN